MKKLNVICFLCALLLLFTAADVFGQIPLIKLVSVQFTSNVKGAKIFLNGKLAGETPFLNKIPVGGYQVRVTAAGYADYEKYIQVREDTTINIELQRTQRVFEVSVNSDPRGAKVYIDDKFAGDAPVFMKLPEGEHAVRVTAEGYDDYTKTIRVNGDVKIMADLHRRIREFNLSVTANVRGAQVSVDDNVLGRVPFRGRIEEGQHVVRVTAEGFEEYAKTIDVNGDVRLNADLRRVRRTFTLTIGANVDNAKVSINGQEQNGFAPMDLRLDEGRYAVRVTRRGYGSFETTVDLNRDMRIEARLIAPKARVLIQAPERRGPGGLRLEVYLDGRRQAGTEFEVERGRHVVRVEAGGLVAEREIDVREGRLYRFKLDLDLQAPQEEDR